MEYIASLSYGKDSMYMLEVIHQNGYPLDRIVTVDIYFDKDLLADTDETIAFKKYADFEIFRRYGLKVEHIRSEFSYVELFYTKFTKGKFNGEIRGFATRLCNWCTRDLKVKPVNDISNKGVNYIGYAIDEKAVKRQKIIDKYLLNDSKKNVYYPLVDHNITEKQAYFWCKENNLLNPSYNTKKRDGCWFCYNAGLQELYDLRLNEPLKWQKLLALEQDSLWSARKEVSYSELDYRFSKDCVTKKEYYKYLDESMFIGSL